MKKSLGLGVIGAIGAVVGGMLLLATYYGMGFSTERMLKNNIAALGKENGMSLVLKNYHRGWFKSSAEITWTMKSSQSVSTALWQHSVMLPKKEYILDIPLTIYHGPIIVSGSKLKFGLGYADAEIELPSLFEQELSEDYVLPANKLKAKMNVFVSYLSKITTRFLVPNYTLHAKKTVDYIQWQDLKSEIVLGLNKQQMHGGVSLNGFAWSKDDLEGILSSVRTTYDIHQSLYNLYVGTATLDLPSILITQRMKDQPPRSILRMVGLQIRTGSNIENELFDTSISVKLKELGVSNKEYIDNNLTMSIKNLDASTLASMNRKLVEMQHTAHLKQPTPWAMIADLPALLSKGAQLTVEAFEINMPDGHIKADVYLNLPNEIMSNPFQLLQKINGESHLRVSKLVLNTWLKTVIKRVLLQKEAKKPNTSSAQENQPAAIRINVDAEAESKAAEKIKELKDTGVLVEEDKNYLLLMTLTNGALLINGHPISPAMLSI